MNQILSVESPKKNKKIKTGNNTPIEIEKIVKFFAIIMIIFGIFMVGTGSYAMYQNSKLSVNSSKPSIYLEDTAATEITMQISHNKELSKVTYRWNNEDEIEIDCNGKKKVEEKIEIPTGKNTLYVNAVDVNGLEGSIQKQYTLQGDIEIEAKLSQDERSVIITAEGKEQLSYMTYRWDEEEEITVEIGDMKTEQTINNIPEGQHTLTVVVVDINNKTETIEQEVKGVPKPKVEITTDGSSNFVIKASDEEGIKTVEFIINETDKNVLHLDQVWPSVDDRKEFEYKYPLHDGENKLEVRVYNESDVRGVFKALVRK